MKLTNQQIIDAVNALVQFNPQEITAKTKFRLNRNLRKLKVAFDACEHDRQRLIQSVSKKKTELVPEGKQRLTPEEELDFQPLYQQLLAEEEEVELQPVEIREDGDCFIPLALYLKTPNIIVSSLLDIILVEPKE